MSGIFTLRLRSNRRSMVGVLFSVEIEVIVSDVFPAKLLKLLLLAK